MNVNDIALRYENLKDSARRHSYLTITDNGEVIVDGCRGIEQYDDNSIRLRLPRAALQIVGFGLRMSNYCSCGVIIRGTIYSLTFEERENERKHG